jgi:chromosome partitioning protein
MARNPRIIAVVNEKGGVGKTATVVNLGAGLSRLGKKVLLVDMDPQFNTTKGVGVRVTDDMLSIYSLLSASDTVPAANAVVKTRWEGLDLLPSHIDLAGFEVETAGVAGRENRLKEAMASLNGAYDIILVDTPPSLSLLTVNVFAYAGEVLVPCQTHPYAYDALEDLFDTISIIREGVNPKLGTAGIVPTFFDARTRVSRNVLEMLKNHEIYGKMLLDTVIRANTTIAESAAVSKPVVFYRTASFGARDYMELAKELMDKKKRRKT